MVDITSGGNVKIVYRRRVRALLPPPKITPTRSQKFSLAPREEPFAYLTGFSFKYMVGCHDPF
jgi:hypothetical protein